MIEPSPESRSKGEARSAFRKILRNAGSILLGDAAGQVLIGAAIALAAVRLGPTGFGVMSEAQAFVEPFDAVAVFGLQQVAITIAAQRGGADGTLRGTVLGLQMILAVFAVVAAIGIALVTGRGRLLPVIAVLCINTLFIPLTTISALAFQYDQAMHRLLAVPFVGSVMRFGGAITASRKLNVPIGHVLAYVAGNVTVSLLTFFSMKRFYPGKLHFDRALARQLVVIAWPAGVLEFVVMAYSRGSYFFLHSQGAHAQGEYAAADRLVRPVLSIAGALFMSSLPTVATLAVRRDFETLRRMYLKTMVRIVQGLVPLMFASWLLASYLLKKVAPEYAGATMPFRILSVGAVFMCVNQLSTTFVVALGKFRVIMIVALVNLVVYLGLAAVLVPRFAATGAATATSIMEAVNTVIQIVIVLALLRSDGRPPQDDGARAPGLA